jgi:SAM-dependent methyltransferase
MRVTPWLASIFTAACAAGTPAPACPTGASLAPGPTPATTSAAPPTPSPVTNPAPKPPPATPTDAQIIKLSHDLLDAYDRGDVAALEAGLASEFVHFESGKPSGRDDELEGVRKRKPDAPTIATRIWMHESVRATADSAIFTGKAAEQQAGNATKGGYKYVGWYLLEWVRRGDAWQARLWAWQRASGDSERDNWNEVFRNGLGFTRQPNRLLVEVTKGRKPGAALDVAMGQGRNALHLAAQGWKVTGVDISDEGIRLAREEAQTRKLALATVNTNIDEYDFGKNRWDLVTMIYAGSNLDWIEKIKPSLRPGGLFVVEYFASDNATVMEGFAPGQLAKLFATGFEILRDEVVEDVPDWAMDRAKLVRFVAKKR